MDDNKARIDEIFKHLSESAPVQEPGIEVDGDRVSFKAVLKGFISDYSGKLGLDMDVSKFRVLKDIEPEDRTNYLPFLANSLALAMHYNKAASTFARISGINVDDLYSQLFMPMFVTSAGIATRIHNLAVAPELDTSCLDPKRFSGNMEFANAIAERFVEADSDNRHRWIMFLTFDATAVVMQALSSILYERSDPMAMMAFSSLVEPMMAEISAHFTTEMLATSVALDTMA